MKNMGNANRHGHDQAQNRHRHHIPPRLVPPSSPFSFPHVAISHAPRLLMAALCTRYRLNETLPNHRGNDISSNPLTSRHRSTERKKDTHGTNGNPEAIDGFLAIRTRHNR